MQNCPRCGFKGWLKTNKFDTEGIRFWKCGRCGSVHEGDRPFVRQKPRVVYIDIEKSLTDLRGNFGLRVRGEYINHKRVKHPSFIICWSANVVGENKIHSACVTKEEALARTDKNILAPLWDLLDGADIIAGHNVRRYDIKHITSRFMVNGFSKIEPAKTYDTLLMARHHGFESCTLDYLGRLFGFGGKDKMTDDDWDKIQDSGDEKALRKMLRYNRGDVLRGVKILNLFLEWETMPKGYGLKKFAKEPVDKRSESVKPLRDMQDTLDNLEYEIGELRDVVG